MKSTNVWMVGPGYDLLFVANVTWHLVFWLGINADDFSGRTGLQFWQVYFVTTPHRWITLGLVFLDRSRFLERPMVYVTIALAAVLICSSVLIATGQLFCLLAIDYLWNAWHFAAQHHGIYRLYRRKSTGDGNWAFVEKMLLRCMILVVSARVAGGIWLEDICGHYLNFVDAACLGIPVLLLLSLAVQWSSCRAGALVYLCSVLTLYSCLLLTVRWRRPVELLALTTSSALFHATEYLAIVSWSVSERSQKMQSRMGLMSRLAEHWGRFLVVFLSFLGSIGWLADQHWMEAWLLINVIAAFMHYAYDGLIWRRAKPAQALTVNAQLLPPVTLDGVHL